MDSERYSLHSIEASTKDGWDAPKSDSSISLEGGANDTESCSKQSSARREITGVKWILVLVALYSTATLYGVDTTIVADIQAAAVDTLGEIEKLSWMGIGFPLGSVAVIFTLGKAYGLFDVKWLYVISILVFEGGSTLCGVAPSMNGMIVGRVIAGAGGAGLYLGVLNIISILTTEHERPLYIALVGVCWGAGTILGPIVGGAVSDSSATWRWAFYLNLVIAIIMVPVYLFYIPSLNPQPNKSTIQKFKEIDWLGSVLNAAIYTTWAMGITFGGAQWAWSSGKTISVFVVCGFLIIAFTIQQRFAIFTTKTQRIFPAAFLTDRSLLLLFFCTACSATALFVPVYYIPLFFQFTRNDTTLEAAVRLLPYVCITILFILLNGAAMPKFGYYMPWYVISGACILIGGSLMYTVDSNSSASAVYGYSILIAIGTGGTNQASYSVAPVRVAKDPRFGPSMVPDAIGFMNTAQKGSIVHALAISGTVFQNLAFHNLKSALAGMGFSDAQLHAAIGGTKSDILTNASEEVKNLAVKAIVDAMDRVYILVIAAGAFCLVCSLFLKREKLFIDLGVAGA